MGWWPLARPFQSGDAVNVNDAARPFYGLDYGNQGNYVINQGSPKRTFGVTGYWHRDVGNNTPGLADTGAVVPGPDVEWKPIGGGASAWCGLRGQGDNAVDPVTGTPTTRRSSPTAATTRTSRRARSPSWEPTRISRAMVRSGTRCSIRTSSRRVPAR
jgi:hypothetical protein